MCDGGIPHTCSVRGSRLGSHLEVAYHYSWGINIVAPGGRTSGRSSQ